MISEPEMVGDFPAWPEPETATSEDRPPPPRGRRPWLWALGGAAVASAVWAGALYAYGSPKAVDTRGYRVHGEGLCEKAELNALALNLGKRGDESEELYEHRARDKVTCYIGFEPTRKPAKDELSAHYQVELTAEIHKVTDPGPEFEAYLAEPSPYGDGTPPKPKKVTGLGENAYLTDTGEDGRQLMVLDGGAVLSLQVSAGFISEEDDVYEEPAQADAPELDLSELPPLMVEDMRDFMATLKS
ncbi:hypothetical protein J7E96_11665 [Streptomyces sp. ISL-96]|uniref:hypothetical protein n=1 Tax=Streptomyces sp. ISL-96 TaxID=2819191 RepID=UPI001BE55CDC|nr:hypothetical protein [Streptomyces sp. ISL-96]MBT2489167.1 hypothetical protein [Streptomyces sp. ISL-96]